MSRESSRPQEIDIVKELAINLLNRTCLEDLLWEIAEAIGRLPGFEDCVVYLLEDDQLVQRAAFGLKQKAERELLEPIAIPLGKGIVGTVGSTGVAEIIADTSQDPRYIHDQFDGSSELAVPVTYEGKVIAVLDTESAKLNAYTHEDLEMLQTMANISASRIASAIKENENERLSREYARLNKELESRVLRRTQQLEATNSDLIIQRDRLASILNSIRDGLICTDHNFIIRLFSPSAADITGWPMSEALGRSLDEVFRLRNVATTSELIIGTMMNRGARESVLVNNLGEERDIRWGLSVSQFHESSREFVIVFGDTTEDKILARQAEQIQRLESLGILAGGIAHDFNNNLTAIQSALTVVEIGEGKSVQEALEVSSLACKAASSLAQQLMTFAKGGEPIRQSANLRELLQNAASVVLPRTDCRVNWNLPTKDLYVLVDPGQMSQVFCNLFLNAAQAMNDSGEIHVIVETADNFAKVLIRDEGPGVDEDILGNVFEPYYSSKPSGAGLGLTISYFIMKRHGGKLELTNHESGALVSLNLPLAEAVAAAQVQNENIPVAGKKRILVMDDDKHVRKGVSLLVGSFGHTVVEARHGDEALEEVRRHVTMGNKVDLAILDLKVTEGRGGAEVVDEMRAAQSDLLCVVSSGYSQDPIMSRFSEYGFHGVLPKPFNRKEIATVLAELL